MLNYEIGGNEVKVDASESIAAIPENRTLLVEQLTSEEPINPETVTGLKTMTEVFNHFKPQIAIEFEDEQGQSVNEEFHFNSVGDFSVKSMTDQSSFLKSVDIEKNFYDNLIKQFRSNKILQKAIENSESKEAFAEVLQLLLKELDEAEKN